jgi:hypothetical protein
MPETGFANSILVKSTLPKTLKPIGYCRKLGNCSKSKGKSTSKTRSFITKLLRSENGQPVTKNPCQRVISWTGRPGFGLLRQSTAKMIKRPSWRKTKNSWKKYSPSKVHSLDKIWTHPTEKYAKINDALKPTVPKIALELSKPWPSST